MDGWVYVAGVGILIALFLGLVGSMGALMVTIGCIGCREHNPQENENATDIERQFWIDTKREIREAQERVNAMHEEAYETTQAKMQGSRDLFEHVLPVELTPHPFTGYAHSSLTPWNLEQQTKDAAKRKLGEILDDREPVNGEYVRRPYINYFRKTVKQPIVLVRWLRTYVWNSVPSMGAQYLPIIYALQLLALILLHFGVIPLSIYPLDNTLFITVISAMFSLVLGFTINAVLTNSRRAMFTLISKLYGSLSAIANITFPTLADKPGVLDVKIDVTRFPGRKRRDRISSESLSVLDVFVEIRHSLVAFQYMVVKNSVSDFRVNVDKLSVLTDDLRNEMDYGMFAPSNQAYITRLISLFTTRMDLLYTAGAISPTTQSSNYKRPEAMNDADSDIAFSSSDLGQPVAFFHFLLVLTWILLIYYTFVLYTYWGFFGTALAIWLPNFAIHGLVWFSYLYNNPYELALKGRLAGVDMKKMMHNTVANFDQQFLYLVQTIESQTIKR